MGELVLKPEIMDKIKSDPILYGLVADSVGVSPMSLPGLIYKNSPKFTQAKTLIVIKGHLGVSEDTELLEEMQVTA